MLKIVFLTLLALSAKQINSTPLENALVQDELVSMEVHGTLENAKKAIQSLDVAVRQVANDALSQWKTILESRLEAIAEIEHIAVSHFNISVSECFLSIKTLVDRANSMNVDISDCLTGQDELNALLSKTDEEVDNCGQKWRDSIVNINVSVQTSISNTLSVVDDLNKQATQCAASSTADKCFLKLDVAIGEDLVLLPSQITSLIKDVILDVTIIEGDFLHCSYSVLDSTVFRATDILEDITECANKKSPPA